MVEIQWKNVSIRKCRAVWDILSLVHKQVGELPDNQTPEKLRKTTAEALLNYAKQVLNDDNLWSKIPLTPKPTKHEVAEKEKILQQLTTMRKELRNLIKSCQ